MKADVDDRACFGLGAGLLVGQPFSWQRLPAIACLAEENAELAVRHFMLVDVIGSQPDLVSGFFGRLSVVISHRECAAGDEHHGGPVAVADDDQRPARRVNAGLNIGLKTRRNGPHGDGCPARGG